MKKVIILGLSVLALGISLVSCDKDDDAVAAPVTVEGKWIFSKEGDIVDGQEVLIDYEGNEEGCAKDFITINADGTMVQTDFYILETCQSNDLNATWSKSESTISFLFEGEDVAEVYDIITLDGSTLKLKNGDSTYVFVR